MFSLFLERSRFYRVKEGQSAALVEKTFCCPVAPCAAGNVVALSAQPMRVYEARAGDDYAKVAARFHTDAALLQAVNLNRCLYPTRPVFLPQEGAEGNGRENAYI